MTYDLFLKELGVSSEELQKLPELNSLISDYMDQFDFCAGTCEASCGDTCSASCGFTCDNSCGYTSSGS